MNLGIGGISFEEGWKIMVKDKFGRETSRYGSQKVTYRTEKEMQLYRDVLNLQPQPLKKAWNKYRDPDTKNYYMIAFVNKDMNANERLDYLSFLVKSTWLQEIDPLYHQEYFDAVKEGFIDWNGNVLLTYDFMKSDWKKVGKLKSKRKPSIRRAS